MNDALTFSLDTITQAAAQCKEWLQGHDVCTFDGALGAGKTTFIKALCQQLGVEDMVNSPTFAIVNEYRDAEGQPLYHMDCYRLRSLAEALDSGLHDLILSGHRCLIEWPQLLEPLLPDNTLRLKIDTLPNGTRTLSVQG